MTVTFIIALVCLAIMPSAVVGGENSYSPMVAFVCDMGAMHMDANEGWYRDPNTDCIEDKRAVLDYCKAVYPSLDVTNIVETIEHVVIKGWCPLGESACASPQTYKIRPYRCLVGAFQSDALVVPHGCVFDHLHSSDSCQSHDWWGQKAVDSCLQSHSMQAVSFGVLLPCGTDVFTGVEFVCCPSTANAGSAPANKIDKPSIKVKVSAPNSDAVGVDSDGVVVDSDGVVVDDVIQRYMEISGEDFDNEHEAYERAKQQLLKQSHDQITTLMKEWSEVRFQLADSENSADADRLTADYQQRYSALQTRADSLSLQLDAIHQQHVQSAFSGKKKTAMSRLMQQLQATDYIDVKKIMKLLQRYISIEEKDAQHCINHFLKIRDRDVSAAMDMLPATREHLQLISLRINQSIGLLDTLGDKRQVVEKMKSSVSGWLHANYTSIDNLIKQLDSLTSSPSQPTRDSETSRSQLVEALSGESTGELYYKKYAEQLKHRPEFMEDPATLEEEAEPEDEHNHMTPVRVGAGGVGVDHMRFSSFDAAEQKNKRHEQQTAIKTPSGVIIAITCSLLCAVMVVVVSLLLVKKRHRQSGGSSSVNSNTYLKVAAEIPDVSPEDRHISAMQENGYENPTYKLLEQRRT